MFWKRLQIVPHVLPPRWNLNKRKKSNFGGEKCPRCDASFLGKDTTFDNLVAKLQKDLSDLSVDFGAYGKFRQNPSFEDIYLGVSTRNTNWSFRSGTSMNRFVSQPHRLELFF